MVRPLDTSGAKTTCQRLTRLVAIAAIALGSPQAVTAGSLFGNVTADLFAPAVELSSVVDVDDVNAASRARVLESEDGGEAPEAPETLTTVAEEPLVLGSIQVLSVSQREPLQTSLRPPTGTSIDVSDLRNPTRRRPTALLPLYVTFATLQMLDAHSTTTALKNGAVEENPVVAALAGHTGVLYATKIAATAATVYVGEKLWRKNRFAAIMTMVAINSAYAVVVHRNYGVANR